MKRKCVRASTVLYYSTLNTRLSFVSWIHFQFSLSIISHTTTLIFFFSSIPGVSDSLRADFAKGDGRVKRKEEERRKTMEPSETLFVVNFIETTRVQDLEMLFEKYGRVVRVDMKRNYAFVQFETIEEATKAKEATDGGKLDQAVLTVEYVASRKSSNTNSYDDRRPAGGRGAGYYNQDRRGPRRDSGYSSRGPPPRYADGYSRDRRPPPSFQPRDDGNYSGGYDPRGPPPRRRSRSRSRSPPRRYENDYRYDPPNPQGSRGYDDSRYYDRRERGYR